MPGQRIVSFDELYAVCVQGWYVYLREGARPTHGSILLGMPLRTVADFLRGAHGIRAAVVTPEWADRARRTAA